MKPATRVLLARIIIPIALVIAVVGVITGNWFVVVAMVLAIALQAISYRANRGRPD